MRKPTVVRAGGNGQSGRETEYAWIRVKKILLPKSDDKLEEKTVAGIPALLRRARFRLSLGVGSSFGAGQFDGEDNCAHPL
jgi:hypothetical protein